MTTKQFAELLKELGACSEAVGWAQDKSFHVVWTTCKRGDWLLWLCGIMADKRGWPTRKQLVLAACACAETALKYVPAGEERPRKAIETARAWTRGEATIEEVRAAANAANAAYAAAYAANAANAAANAAYAAAYAANAANAAYAANAAANAAYAAAYAAYAAAYAAYAANAAALKECADLVRVHIPEPFARKKAAQ
jgi:hypothetical protein